MGITSPDLIKLSCYEINREILK